MGIKRALMEIVTIYDTISTSTVLELMTKMVPLLLPAHTCKRTNK